MVYNRLNKLLSPSSVRVVFYFFALALAALMAWRTRYRVNSDAMAYLDMGDALVRGEWNVGINGQWSPLYPLLLGLVRFLSHPSPFWESTVAHFVNFAVYCGALFCFEFFFRELNHHREQQSSSEAKGLFFQKGEWFVLGYTLFIGSSLILIRISTLAPDLLVAAFVYLAAGLLLRIRRGLANWLTFILLGAVLGMGYLAKTPMFILAFVFLTVSALLVGDLKKATPRVVTALAIFLIIGSAYFVPLSKVKGRWTFGDSGKLNWAWHMNKVPFLHWQGQPPGSGTPKHPTRKILDHPEVYEFADPISGTYPPWYDPSYWCDGVRPHFEIKQIGRLLSNTFEYYFLFVYSYQISLTFALVLILTYMPGGWRAGLSRILQYWFLLVPVIAAIGMYWLVHVEWRYLSPFIVLLWLGLFSGVRLPESQESRKLVTRVFIVLMITMGIQFAYPLTVLTESEQASDHGHVQWQVAKGLRDMGLQPGDKVATLGSGYTAYWARLDQVKIVAETQDPNSFWQVDESLKDQVVKAFSGVGARAIIATDLPDHTSTPGWLKIGDTNYYVHFLAR